MRAAIYCRVSKQDQVDGYSLDQQLDACRRLCRERGWTIAAEFIEPGESGKTFAQRPKWLEFMQAARAGAFDVLVSHKIDRFSRATVIDALTTLDELRRSMGVSFASASEPIDLTTPYGELILMMLLWLARHYLLNLSNEVKKGRRGRAESGRSNANRPPFGYVRNADGDDVPDEATRGYAVATFEQYASGAMTDSDLARWLKAAGVRTLDGNPFTPAAVREMLINPFYCGFVRYRGIREPLTNARTKRKDTRTIVGIHEPLVTQALFEKVQQLRAMRAGSRVGHSSKQKRAYLLQGIARCATCGERMKCSCSHDGKLRYECNAGNRGLDCELSGRTIREEVLLAQIDETIAGLQLPDTILERAAELLQLDERIDQAKARRAEIVAEMKRADYMFQKGRKTQDAYDKDIARLEAELAMLEPIERTTLEESGSALADLLDAWRASHDDNAARHDILKALLVSVDVDLSAGQIVKWQPRPEFEELFRRGHRRGSDRTRNSVDGWNGMHNG